VGSEARALDGALRELSALERRVMAAVRAVLPAGVQTGVRTRNAGMSVTIQRIRLSTCWATDGWLGDVRCALDGRRIDLVVARRLTPAARAALSLAGVAWVDETGAAEIALPHLVVSRTGDPTRLGPREARWTPSAFAVAEALLSTQFPATVAAMREATGLSTGSCTVALASLTDMGLLSSEMARGRASARTIVDRRVFLAAYVEASSEMAPRGALRVAMDPSSARSRLAIAGEAWDAAQLPWALSGSVAARLLGPGGISSSSTVRVYLRASTRAQLEYAAEIAKMLPAPDGVCSLVCQPTVTACALATRHEGLRVAPWARVYADLVADSDGGESEAERLFSNR